MYKNVSISNMVGQILKAYELAFLTLGKHCIALLHTKATKTDSYETCVSSGVIDCISKSAGTTFRY